MVRVALANARAHRGPALVDLAANLLREEVPSAEVAPSAYRLIDPAPVDLEAVRRAAQLVRDARRPALLVGDQLMHRSAHGPLTSLLESQRLPCATVDYAKGVIPEDHPWLLGLLGECGHGSVTEYLSEADLVLAFGVRLTEVTTFGWDETLFPNLIQVDSVAGEIGRALPIRDGILGDPLATVRALAEELGPVTEARQELQDVVSALRYKHGVYAPPAAKQNQLSTPILAHTLRTTTPRETVLVTDTGMTAQYMKRHFPVFAPDGSFSLYALAPMGMGLPLALGAQLARPSAPVLNVIGDGGLLVHAGDLNVAAQHGLPVITVVVNNGGYKQIRDRLEHWFGCDYATTISGVDYAALARAFGCDGYSATNPVELADAVQQAVDSKRPAVIDAKVYGDSLLDLMPESVIEWANATFGTAGA
jgi:acetolactate synthase-1/2/3 large subunit